MVTIIQRVIARACHHMNRPCAGVARGAEPGAVLIWLWLAATPIAGAAQGVDAPPAPPPAEVCTVVFGHGRNVTADDDAANASWDSINKAFASVVTSQLSSHGTRVVPVLLPVTVSDLAAIVDALLERADHDGCTRIVEATLFADDEADVLVARLRGYPVLREGRSSRIGSADYSHQQEYPNTQRNRDRLVPAVLGREFALAYLKRGAQ